MELHVESEELKDAELPSCTREERWERFPKGESVQYAVMKSDKSKRAARVFGNLVDATKYIKGKKGYGADSFIEVRYAVRKRCERYCSVKNFCHDYVEYLKEKKSDTLNDKIMMGDL